jgi:hypothetical protein
MNSLQIFHCHQTVWIQLKHIMQQLLALVLHCIVHSWGADISMTYQVFPAPLPGKVFLQHNLHYSIVEPPSSSSHYLYLSTFNVQPQDQCPQQQYRTAFAARRQVIFRIGFLVFRSLLKNCQICFLCWQQI